MKMPLHIEERMNRRTFCSSTKMGGCISDWMVVLLPTSAPLAKPEDSVTLQIETLKIRTYVLESLATLI